MELESWEFGLFGIVSAWFATGDIYYRDTAKALMPIIATGFSGEFEELCHKHLIEFPEDDFYKNALQEAIKEIQDGIDIKSNRT